MPCTCAAKRDVDVDALPKAAALNLSHHRRVQSHGAKPAIASRRSDSLVPRNQLSPHHPPLHRMNNAAHELGMPYILKRYTTSSPNVSTLAQRSEDNLQLGAQAMPPQTTSMPMNELSNSVPTTGWDPSQPPSLDVPNQQFSSADFLQPRLDTSFVNNALSPGNPSRYSMNDFSKLSYPNFTGGPIYGQHNYALSAEVLGSTYSDWGTDTPSYSQGNTAMHTPQRLSVASVDQPGLTHSPSNTISEAGSSAYPNDTNYPNFGPQQGFTINPSFTNKDYFNHQGLDTVSENMGDTPSESFVYRTESASSMDDIFGSGPGPAEPAIKSEPMDYGMADSLATTDPFTSSEPGPSLVVPQFTNYSDVSGQYADYSSPSPAAQPQPQPQQQYYDQPMATNYGWEFSSSSQ